jgi:hypothetical protein
MFQNFKRILLKVAEKEEFKGLSQEEESELFYSPFYYHEIP